MKVSATFSFRKNSCKSKKLEKKHFAGLYKALFLILLVWGQSAFAREGFAKIAAVGSGISGVQDESQKANQSQVVWHDSNWWGVFKRTSSQGWWIYKYANNSWSPHVSTGISSAAEADLYLDEGDDRLYVLISSAQELSRLSYNGSSWSVDDGFPKGVSINANSNDPACITGAADGDLFIFYVDNNLRGLHSTNQGDSWTGPFSIASISGSSLTDAISFRYNSTNYVGVFVGRGDGAEFSFRRIADNQDPSNSSNWLQETLPISNDSDDHTNITKDSDNNLYMIGKWGSSNNFRLYKRNNNGNWSYYNITPNYATRPSLAIDESNNNLIIIGTVRTESGANKIQCYVMNKNNLHDVGNDDWIVVLENGSDVFNDATVSYQIVDNTSNLMVCASNTDANNIWYNLLDVSDITLPVFLASFQATPGADQINLEWVTQSEVDNWEFIVFRQEDKEEEFREITRLPGSGTTNVASYYNYIDSDVEPGVTYAYRLANVDYNGQINYYPEIVRISLSPVATYKLYANYPNPFNSETNISFEVGQAAYTELNIFDTSGRLVKRLFEGHLSPGSYVYKWNGKDDRDVDVASGVYFLNFSAETFNRSLRLVLSR